MVISAEQDIEASYIDAKGNHQTIDAAVLAALVKCLPSKSHHAMLPPSVVQRNQEPVVSLDMSNVNGPIAWELLNENGKSVKSGSSAGLNFSIPHVTHGLYSLAITSAEGELDRTPFLSVPSSAYPGSFERTWILAVQLYGIRSARNWGIGDFSDLKSILRWCASAGAGGVGLNPMHALFDDHPSDCSPYSPNSRLYLNTLYINVEGLPWLDEKFIAAHAALITKLRDPELVDYSAVGELKLRALRNCFENFVTHATTEQRAAFDNFRRLKGRSLRRYGCFEVLRRLHKGPWWEWPQPWRQPNDSAIDDFLSGEHSRDVEFIEFAQWCADMQLQSCEQLARELKLSIGLYLDLAVGVKADGFDAWSEQTAISRTLSVGAPPDILNTAGQDWGLAGFNSSGLEAENFKPFRSMIAAAMRYAGAIRLDHVLGLNRLYLIPKGNTPDKGAYVRMPLEALLAVVALESDKHRCIVIGEDLGTVPDGFREKLAEWGIWSYRVMMFERDHDGAFFPPEHYPKNSLVTFNTHDLPTFEGWNSAHDIGVRKALGIDPGETPEARQHASQKLAELLGPPLFSEAIRFMTETPARVLAIGIEDLLNILDQANIPGTIDQHPNWRRKLPFNVENWSDHLDVEKIRGWVANRVFI